MKHAIAIIAIMLAGCGQAPDWYEVREHAIRMRLELNESVREIRANGYLIDVLCRLRGTGSEECRVMHGMWEVTRATVEAAHSAIDLYDATGVGLASAQRAIMRVRDAARDFGLAAAHVREVAGDVIADQVPYGAGVDPTNGATQGEGSAPAAGSGAAPAAPAAQ